MRALLALVAIASVVTFVPPAFAQGHAAAADCAGSVCDLLNRFCHCLGHAAAAPAPSAPATEARCNGDVCDSVDRVCKLYKPGWDCVAVDGSTHAAAPMCDGCDAIIEFCEKHFHTQCVETTGADLRCASSVCQDVDRICARWGAHCVA